MFLKRITLGIFNEYKGLRRELYILFIGRVMTSLGTMIWPMFTLILSEKLGMSAESIAVYMLIYSIVSVPVNLLGGKLADRFNKRNIIIVCDCISILAYLYCAFVPLTTGSIVVFLVAALFQSVEWPCYDALVADFTASADRERAYSLSYLGMNLGLLLAPTIGGLLLKRYLNIAFLINGLAIALSTGLIFCFVKDVHREKDDSPEAEYEGEVNGKVSAISLVFKNPVVLLFIIASLMEMAVYEIWCYLMPLDMANVYGETGAVLFGTMNSVNCVVVVVFTAIVTRLFLRVSDTNKMFIGESLMVLSYVIFMFFVKSPYLCYAAIVVFTFGEIFNALSMTPFLTRRIPASHRGRIMSYVSVLNSLAGGSFKVIVGKIYDGNGSLPAWTLVSAVGAFQLIVLLMMKKKDRKLYPALYK